MKEPTEKQKIGRIGEDIAIRYLENKGFSVIGKNYLKKCGEIDIIAKKVKILHFIEVKTVSHENFVSFSGKLGMADSYRPEDNIHAYKLKRLARVVQVYLLEKCNGEDPEWQFDAVTVRLDMKTRRAKVEVIDNIIL